MLAYEWKNTKGSVCYKFILSNQKLESTNKRNNNWNNKQFPEQERHN